jgi:hypothetical protein
LVAQEEAVLDLDRSQKKLDSCLRLLEIWMGWMIAAHACFRNNYIFKSKTSKVPLLPHSIISDKIAVYFSFGSDPFCEWV